MHIANELLKDDKRYKLFPIVVFSDNLVLVNVAI